MLMRKSIIIAAVLLALSFVFAGCGSNTSGGINSGSGNSSDSNNSNNSSNSSNGEAPKTSSNPVKLLTYSKWPDDNFISQGLREFSQKVKEATGGKVELDVNTGGALGYKGPELLKTVRDDLVPVSDIFTSELAGDEPLFAITTVPFLIRDYEEGKIFNEVARPYFSKVAEEKWNQKILYSEPWPYAGFWTKNKVESLADMKGMKMRTYDENGARVVEAAGGTPHPLPFSEVYSSLATGVIDSVLTSSPTAVDGKFWEVLKYYVPTNVTAGYSLVTINLDEFNKLDKETQEAILKVGEEMDKKMWDNVVKQDGEKLDIVKEKGITVLQPSDQFLDDLSKIGDEIRDNWLKDAPPEAKELIDKFNEKVGR
jgi:TRAP-type C4-dicarboxylate transport system substrate-binding protein